MAQGAVKKSKPVGKSNQSKTLGPKPGAKVIKPKRAKLVAKQKLIKKHTSGLTAMTEKNLAEKAGHLELLQGGKKQKKKDRLQKALKSSGAKK